METSSALPLVGREDFHEKRRLWKTTCLNRLREAKTDDVLGAARWPVLKWPRMAGFQVATEGLSPCGENSRLFAPEMVGAYYVLYSGNCLSQALSAHPRIPGIPAMHCRIYARVQGRMAYRRFNSDLTSTSYPKAAGYVKIYESNHRRSHQGLT